jgi:sarcosine oxidase gamma subunit
MPDLPDGTAVPRESAAPWSDCPDWGTAVIEREQWRARPVSGLHQVTLNGDVRAACAALAPDAGEVGLWGQAATQSYMVRLARDRALLVTPQRVEAADGTWQEAGWVASNSDDAFLVFELSGPAVADIVREGTSADLACGSPSASILFAGVAVALYRSGAGAARIHVTNDMGPYLWRWLETR